MQVAYIFASQSSRGRRKHIQRNGRKTNIMNLQNSAYTLMLSLILPLSASADIINIANLAPNDSGNIVSGFTVSGGALVGSTRTFTLTQTGDLDSGTLDDTLSFDLIYNAYTGSTFSGGDVTLGTASTPNVNNVNWHNNNFTTGNTLSLEVANISYADGEGDETAVFNGFTSIRSISFGAGPTTPAGDIDYYVGLVGATTVTGDPTFTPSLTSNGTSPTLFFTAANGPVRLRDIDLQFETVTAAVPEPSSFALIGGVFACFAVSRRRRSRIAA